MDNTEVDKFGIPYTLNTACEEYCAYFFDGSNDPSDCGSFDQPVCEPLCMECAKKAMVDLKYDEATRDHILLLLSSAVPVTP